MVVGVAGSAKGRICANQTAKTTCFTSISVWEKSSQTVALGAVRAHLSIGSGVAGETGVGGGGWVK